MIIDCLLNLTISIAYVSTAPWKFGEIVCDVNSFATLLVTIEMALSVLLFMCDRYMVAKKFAPYLSLSRLKLNLLILLSWVLSIAASCPIIFMLNNLPYRSRYACNVADRIDQEYLISPLAVAIILPAIVMIVLLVLTLLIFHRERRKQKHTRSGNSFSYIDQILMIPYYRNEFYPTLCLVLILIGYFLLWLPHSALITIDPILTDDWVNRTISDLQKAKVCKEEFDKLSKHKFDLVMRSQPRDQNETFVSTISPGIFESTNTSFEEPMDNSIVNSMNKSLVEDNLTNSLANITVNIMPEISDYVSYEIFIVWLRYIYDLMIPIIILACISDIRYKCKNLIICDPEIGASSSPKRTARSGFKNTPKSSSSKSARNSKNVKVSYKTPVLFPTTEGLHIRTLDDTFFDLDKPKHSFSFGSKKEIIEPKFEYEICDIVLPTDDSIDIEEAISIDEIMPSSVALESYEDGRTLNQSILVGANAALMSNEIDYSYSSFNSKHLKGESAMMELSTMNQWKETPRKKRKSMNTKNVRFDLDNLVYVIPRPYTANSIDSRESTASSDEGYYEVDDEENSIDENPIVNDYNHQLGNINKVNSRFRPTNNNIRSVRNTSQLSLDKFKARRRHIHNRFGKNGYLAQRNQVSPESGGSKGNPKLHNVRSKYMDFYKSNNNTPTP